jgi:glycosyltransferase involved in cell wall biosynthesis
MRVGFSAAIVIPSHNRAGAIAETLASLSQQEGGLGAIQAVYLADDCSTDETVRVATAAWRAPVPLQVVQPPSNRGTYGNVNHAIAKVNCRHDWLLFLHDDDLARPNWLAMMTERMMLCEPVVGTICSSWDMLYPDGSVVPGEDNPSRPVEVIRPEQAAVRSTLMRGCWWHFSGAAIRARTLMAVGPFDPSLPQCADWDWLMRCLDSGWAVEYVPRTLIAYRQHTATVSVRSFQTHRDISESLVLARRYRAFLDPSDAARFYTRLVLRLGRRAARAASRGEYGGIFRAAQMAGKVAVNPFRFA